MTESDPVAAIPTVGVVAVPGVIVSESVGLVTVATSMPESWRSIPELTVADTRCPVVNVRGLCVVAKMVLIGSVSEPNVAFVAGTVAKSLAEKSITEFALGTPLGRTIA
jgi:hypothetical protein